MKTTQKALLLVFLACFAYCQDSLDGNSGIQVRTGVNTSSCFLKLFNSPEANKVTIQQAYVPVQVTGPEALPEGCNAQNILFQSLFKNDSLGDQISIPVEPPVNGTTPFYNASIDAETLSSLNGTACVSLPQKERAGLDQYMCRIMYAATPLYWAFWTTGNLTFDTSVDSARALVTDRRTSKVMSGNNYVITPNSTFPDITADLYDACGATNKVISALSNQVTVTTTADLKANLPGTWMTYALVKKNSAAAPGEYRVVVSPSTTPIFDNSSNNNNGCWNLGIKYSDLVPDMAYCAGGCQVSFVFTDANASVYVMETNGLSTSGSSGSTGTNSTGGNNNTSTGNNNNNNNAAKSALSMAFSAVLIVISVAYFAL